MGYDVCSAYNVYIIYVYIYNVYIMCIYIMYNVL